MTSMGDPTTAKPAHLRPTHVPEKNSLNFARLTDWNRHG